MRHRKIGFLALFLLLSSASLAFASLTLFWPIEKTPKILSPELLSSEMISHKTKVQKTALPSSSLNYQAWRRIYASA